MNVKWSPRQFTLIPDSGDSLEMAFYEYGNCGEGVSIYNSSLVLWDVPLVFTCWYLRFMLVDECVDCFWRKYLSICESLTQIRTLCRRRQLEFGSSMAQFTMMSTLVLKLHSVTLASFAFIICFSSVNFLSFIHSPYIRVCVCVCVCVCVFWCFSFFFIFGGAFDAYCEFDSLCCRGIEENAVKVSWVTPPRPKADL